MHYTEHAKKRGQQRGIKTNIVELTLQHGKRFYRPGGASEFIITKKQKVKIIDQLKDTIKTLDRSSAIAVLVDNNCETIITTYHKK